MDILSCISGPRMISHCGNVFGDVSGMISACSFFFFVFRSHASNGYFGVFWCESVLNNQIHGEICLFSLPKASSVYGV